MDSWAWPELLIAALGMFILGAVWITDARAHSWYDASCCRGDDCAPVDWIKKHQDGRWFARTKHGTMVFDKDISIRNSKDGKDHACLFKHQKVAHGLYRGRCLYLAVRV